MKYEWEEVPETAGTKIRVSAGLVDELPIFLHRTGSIFGIYQTTTANPAWSRLETTNCDYWGCGRGVKAMKLRAEDILGLRQKNRVLLASLSRSDILVKWKLGVSSVLRGFWVGNNFIIGRARKGGVATRYILHMPSKFDTAFVCGTKPLELILHVEDIIRRTEPVAYMSKKLQAVNRK